MCQRSACSGRHGNSTVLRVKHFKYSYLTYIQIFEKTQPFSFTNWIYLAQLKVEHSIAEHSPCGGVLGPVRQRVQWVPHWEPAGVFSVPLTKPDGGFRTQWGIHICFQRKNLDKIHTTAMEGCLIEKEQNSPAWLISCSEHYLNTPRLPV